MYLIPSYGSFIEELHLNFQFVFIAYFYHLRDKLVYEKLECFKNLAILVNLGNKDGPSPFYFCCSMLLLVTDSIRSRVVRSTSPIREKDKFWPQFCHCCFSLNRAITL